MLPAGEMDDGAATPPGYGGPATRVLHQRPEQEGGNRRNRPPPHRGCAAHGRRRRRRQQQQHVSSGFEPVYTFIVDFPFHFMYSGGLAKGAGIERVANRTSRPLEEDIT